MVRNLASTSVGARVVSFSSESKGCEASNVLNDNISKIWLTKDKVPQWICIGFLSASDEIKRTAITTVGWHCWHAYNTNPRMVTVHVSADGNAFKRWDCFTSGPEAGNQLFSCAPITLGIYPYIVLEINDSFGGEATYMNRVYMFAEDLSAIPQPLTTLSTTTLSETNTSALYDKLVAALGSDDEEDEEEENTGDGTSADQHAASSREQRGSVELRVMELEQQLLKLQAVVARHNEAYGGDGTEDDNSTELGNMSEPEDQGNDAAADGTVGLPIAAANATARDSLESDEERLPMKSSPVPERAANTDAPRARESDGEEGEACTVATNTSFATSWAPRESSPHAAEPGPPTDVGRLLDTMQELRAMMARLQERTLATPVATPRSSLQAFSVASPAAAAAERSLSPKEQDQPRPHKSSPTTATPRSSARSSASRTNASKSQHSRESEADKTPRQRRAASKTEPLARLIPREMSQQQQQQQVESFSLPGRQQQGRHSLQDEAIQTSFAIIQPSRRSGGEHRQRHDAAVNTSIREAEPDGIFLFDSDHQPCVSELVRRTRDPTRRRRPRERPEQQAEPRREMREIPKHPQRRSVQQSRRERDEKGDRQRAYESNLEQLRHTRELLRNVDNIPSELVELLQQLHSKLLERTYVAARLEWLRRTRRAERRDEQNSTSRHQRRSTST